MRLWLRLTLVMALLALVPLVIVGSLAVRAATENATLAPEEQMAHEASTLATFVGTWVDGQSRMLAGWQGVWDLRNRTDDYRIGLLRATYKAMDASVTVALVDVDNQPIVPPQYLMPGVAPAGREAGSDARAGLLLRSAPRRLTEEGLGIGDPYLPPGATQPVVPLAAGAADGDQRLIAEVSLGPVASVFAGREGAAAVLVDGLGRPILGADHPYLEDADLDALLDMGLDLTFTADRAGGRYQGAVWSVPYTDWKVVVLAPPSLAEKAAAAIRGHTMRVAGLALFVVLMVGYTIERTLTQSVRELKHHATEVTKGTYDRRNDVDRSDEIGDLGLALNRMSTRLETTERELSSFHSELQERVASRTRDLEDAQAQLVRAGQVAAVADMGAGLAHELNNPLAAILGQVQLLQAGRASDGAAAYGRIEAQAQRCREVVDAMVRLASGEVDPAMAGATTLDVVVTETLEAFQATAEGRAVRVVVAALPDGVAVGLGPVFARRVLTHVLDALTAGLPEGASVTLGVERGDQPAVLLSADQAIALDDDEHDDFRAAGMQLWTAQGLLDLAGGHVEAPEGRSMWRVVYPPPEEAT